MATQAATGESTHRDSATAAREATRAALDSLGGPADALLAFGTVGYDARVLVETMRAAAGPVPICGCSAAGVITRRGSDEGTHALGVMALRSSAARFTPMLDEGLSTDAERLGARIGARARAADAPRLLLIFPDGLTGNAGALLRGIARAAPPGLPVFGGAAGDTFRLARTYQYGLHGAISDGVSALLVEGDLRFEQSLSHGCRTLPIRHRVTRAEGGVVYELDGRPAWHVLREYIDAPTDRFDAAQVPYLALATELSSAEGPVNVIRVPVRHDPANDALFFPGEVRQGERLAMARRDADLVVATATASARELAQRSSGRDPAFVLHADCAGRGRLLFGEAVSERAITPVQDSFGPAVPWLGLHSYGELASVAGEPHFHAYTLALCAAYDEVP